MTDGYTWVLVGGDLVLDLCNTRSWRGDPGRDVERLGSLADYASWRQAVLEAHGTELCPIATESELARVHSLRDTVLQLLDERETALKGEPTETTSGDGPPGQVGSAAQRLLGLWRDALARCTASGGLPLRWTVDRAQPEAAGDQLTLCAVDLLRGNLDRVRRCGLDECGWYFLDTTRNRSRRWCTPDECGNRHRVRAYASRHR